MFPNIYFNLFLETISKFNRNTHTCLLLCLTLFLSCCLIRPCHFKVSCSGTFILCTAALYPHRYTYIKHSQLQNIPAISQFIFRIILQRYYLKFLFLFIFFEGGPKKCIYHNFHLNILNPKPQTSVR